MNYKERVQNCCSLDELLHIWKEKGVVQTSYVDNGAKVPLTIDHRNVFISDGIVNPEEWKKCRKKILFVLKEAYGGDSDWSLTKELSTRAPWSSIWKRIAEWTYGIFNTTDSVPAKYEPSKISMAENNPWLNRIAVINLKKSGGGSSSNAKEIEAYALSDRMEIKNRLN